MVTLFPEVLNFVDGHSNYQLPGNHVDEGCSVGYLLVNVQIDNEILLLSLLIHRILQMFSNMKCFLYRQHYETVMICEKMRHKLVLPSSAPAPTPTQLGAESALFSISTRAKCRKSE